MARPQRNNVDYFPFLCEEGEKMFYLEETYGNDGFATFVKLLRELAKVDFHYLNLSKPSSMMFLSAKCKVSKEVLNSIISDLVELGKFDRELWEENSIIWCQDFIDSIQDAYSKRSNDCIDRNSLLTLLDSLGVRKLSKKKPKPPKQPSKEPVNPQSIVEDTKENESIVEYRIPFEKFWNLYDKKVGKKDKIQKKWESLSLEVQNKILEYIPKYKLSQPDKQYRKNPDTFFNNESWNDEIIIPTNNGKFSTPKSRDEINREANDAREREVLARLRGENESEVQQDGFEHDQTSDEKYTDWTDVT